MQITYLLTSFASVNIAQALCPYAEKAIRDPDFLKAHLEQQGAPVADKALKDKRQTGPGGLPFTTFDENQLIDVTGEYAWVAPGPDDLRGPCPGLNALANHGYFPHSGVVPLAVGASATDQVYGQSLPQSFWYAELMFDLS